MADTTSKSTTKSATSEKCKPIRIQLALYDKSSAIGSAPEKAHAYKALVLIQDGLAGLLSLENPAASANIRNLFKQANSPQVGSEIRMIAALQAHSGKRRVPTSTSKTWASLLSSCTAESLSNMPIETAARRYLLLINKGVTSANYAVRIEINANELVLKDLGCADHTRRDAAWLGEALVAITASHYKSLTLDATDHRGKSIQFRLRNDERTFRAIIGPGPPTYLRVWASGFGSSKILRVTTVFECEFVSPEEYVAGILLCDGR